MGRPPVYQHGSNEISLDPLRIQQSWARAFFYASRLRFRALWRSSSRWRFRALFWALNFALFCSRFRAPALLDFSRSFFALPDFSRFFRAPRFSALIHLRSLIFALIKGQCHEIFYLWFFSSNNFSWPQSTSLATILIFFRIPAEIFDYFSASPVSLTPVNNSLPVSTTPVSDTFTVLERFTGVNDTGKKFLTGVIDTGKTCIRRCQ